MSEERGAARPQTGSGSGRRRRSTSSRGQSTPNLARPIGRVMTVLWIACAAAWIILSAADFRRNLYEYGGYALNATKAEALYGLGQPKLVRTADGGAWAAAPAGSAARFDHWRYEPAGGAIVDVDFANGRSSRISCTSPALIASACPASFGVQVGDLEDDVVARLGRPANEEYGNIAKTSLYPELNLTLHMEQYRVTRMTVQRLPGGGSLPLRYLRWFIP